MYDLQHTGPYFLGWIHLWELLCQEIEYINHRYWCWSCPRTRKQKNESASGFERIYTESRSTFMLLDCTRVVTTISRSRKIGLQDAHKFGQKYHNELSKATIERQNKSIACLMSVLKDSSPLRCGKDEQLCQFWMLNTNFSSAQWKVKTLMRNMLKTTLSDRVTIGPQ